MRGVVRIGCSAYTWAALGVALDLRDQAARHKLICHLT